MFLSIIYLLFRKKKLMNMFFSNQNNFKENILKKNKNDFTLPNIIINSKVKMS